MDAPNPAPAASEQQPPPAPPKPLEARATSAPTVASWILGAVVAISALALWTAVQEKQLSAAFVPPLLLFETLCVVFLVLFLNDLSNGNHIGVESRWGGLGRGSAGWRMSRPLIYLACALLFAAAFGATTAGVLDAVKAKERNNQPATRPAQSEPDKSRVAGPAAQKADTPTK
jgi:hypothetical protein